MQVAHAFLVAATSAIQTTQTTIQIQHQTTIQTTIALDAETPWTEEAAATLSKADALQADGHWNDALVLYEKALTLSPQPAGALRALLLQ